MLFDAASDGLQVIVSTCDPQRYEFVGEAHWTVVRGKGAERLGSGIATA